MLFFLKKEILCYVPLVLNVFSALVFHINRSSGILSRPVFSLTFVTAQFQSQNLIFDFYPITVFFPLHQSSLTFLFPCVCFVDSCSITKGSSGWQWPDAFTRLPPTSFRSFSFLSSLVVHSVLSTCFLSLTSVSIHQSFSSAVQTVVKYDGIY